MNWPKQKIEEARALYLVLKNSQRVATQLGIPSTTVARWCRDLTAIEDQEWDTKLAKLKENVATIPKFSILQWAKENAISVKVARKHVAGVERPFVKGTSSITETMQNNPSRIKVRALYLTGMSYGDIHKETGIPKGTISDYCKDLVDPVKKTRTLSPEKEAVDREQCCALYKKGKTIREVAAELKIRPERVREYCRDIIDHRRESGKRIVNTPKPRLYNQVINDAQVLEIRRTVRATSVKDWKMWVSKFGVSMSVVSMAARGITFKHLNHIEPPITIDDNIPVRRPTKKWITPKIDEIMVAEAIAMYKADPDKWDFTSIAQWMSEKTGRKYRAGHVSILFSNREPDMVMPKKRKYIPPKRSGPRKVYKVSSAAQQRRNQKRKQDRAELRAFMEAADHYEREQVKLAKEGNHGN